VKTETERGRYLRAYLTEYERYLFTDKTGGKGQVEKTSYLPAALNHRLPVIPLCVQS
jgi:hypothetical protein